LLRLRVETGKARKGLERKMKKKKKKNSKGGKKKTRVIFGAIIKQARWLKGEAD